MSRVRTRPTREATRARLFEAAAEVFERDGIGATSVEAIAESAGFSRGAIYSNFAGKDELIIAMLEDHGERSLQHFRDLAKRFHDPADFLAAMRAAEAGRQDPLGRSPLLHMELILYVTRAAKRRPELVKRLRARRALMVEMFASVYGDTASRPIEPAVAGAILLALEDGFRLHRLIDPETTPADSFMRAVTMLQQALDGRTKTSQTVKPAA